jgi:hypothetical protein
MNPTRTTFTPNSPKFKVGDRIRISDNYFNHYSRGKEGTVEEAHVKNSFVDNLVKVKLDSGNVLTLSEDSLELRPSKAAEGEEINAKDIKVGQTIRVTYETVIGSYKQVSTKEGVVTRIKTAFDVPVPVAQPEETEIAISFGSSKQFYTLIKDAPEVDEIAEALKEAKPGSVAQVEDDGFGKFVLTYVKTNTRDSVTKTPLWTEQDSRYAASNRSVLESVVRAKIRSLDQIVVKL